MFKKKPIYIILLIIFTLLLGADILAYTLTANASSSTPDISSRPQMSENMPGLTEDSGEAAAQIQSGGEDGTAGTVDGTIPETDSSSEMPDMGDFDPSQMQGGMTGIPGRESTVSGFAAFIAGWWIPIGIFCLLADAFCLFMLIRLSRKRRLEAGGITEEAADATEEESIVLKPEISGYEKRRRKKRRTTRLVIVALVIIVVIILGYIVVRSMYMAQLADSDTVTVVSAEASAAGIDTVISGTGTLADTDAEEITVPGGVEIAAYYIENEDSVAEGDILATVDHTSVIKTMADLQDAMDALDEDIEAASAEEIESSIDASVDGRIKVIYAEDGTDVADTMYDHGALILISLDGLMAADIETDTDLTAGDSVIVTLSDGTEQSGRVDSAADGVVTITVTDDGTVYGDEVTIADKDGNELGTSSLYIHSELKVTGYSGTISDISCDENDEVSSGDTLITLTNTEYTAEYELLIEQRSDYEDEMMTLVTLCEDGNIYAEFAGTVSGIDEENATGYLQTQTGGVTASQTGYALTSTNIISLSAQTGYVATLLEEDPAATTSPAPAETTPANIDAATAAAYTNFAGSVSSISYNAITLMGCDVSTGITNYADYSALGITSDMMTTGKAISPASDTPVFMYENGAWTSCTVSDISSGDVLLLTYDTSGGSDSLVWIIIADKADSTQTGNGGGGTQGSSGGTPSTSSGTTSDSSTTEETEDAYTISETTVMAITPNDMMSVTITIDELDILSVKQDRKPRSRWTPLTARCLQVPLPTLI